MTEEVNGVHFVDELPSTVDGARRFRGRYEPFADECRKKPFVWGVLPRSFETKNQCSNVTSGIKRGEYTAFRPKGKWEAAQRNLTVYVRYLGREE